MSQRREYTYEERRAQYAFIMEHYGKMTTGQIAKRLGIPRGTVISRGRRLGKVYGRKPGIQLRADGDREAGYSITLPKISMENLDAENF